MLIKAKTRMSLLKSQFIKKFHNQQIASENVETNVHQSSVALLSDDSRKRKRDSMEESEESLNKRTAFPKKGDQIASPQNGNVSPAIKIDKVHEKRIFGLLFIHRFALYL